MEMNQKLFDDCTQQYKAERQKEKERNKGREDTWMKVSNLAKSNPQSKLFIIGNDTINSTSMDTGPDEDGVLDLASMAKLEVDNSKEARKKRNDAKPLIRRKSELPHDSTTVRALDTHKRADDYLSTSTENS